MTETSSFPTLTVVDHPLIRHKLTLMRKADTPTRLFRVLLREIGYLLAFEATRHLPVRPLTIETPICTTEGSTLPPLPPLVVPILRAGQGLADGVLGVLTEADVGYIGVFRDEATLMPVEYLVKLPSRLAERLIVVCDPMLATGHSAEHAIKVLVRNGARPESIVFLALVAAPEGVAVLAKAFPQLRIITAALDDHLNENGYIVPGLGDAGDRLYGTV